MRLRIFTQVYGSKYISWLRDGLLNSLRWPGNLRALKAYADIWDVYCNPDEVPVIRDLLSPFEIPIEYHGFYQYDYTHITQHHCIIHHGRLCAESKKAMFVAPPDTIFGEGSLESLFAYGEAPGTCVSMVHMRVNSAINQSWAEPVSNPKLVSLAFQNMHPTWTYADMTLRKTNSKIAGVAWRKISGKLWLCQHRLPTCYLANINQSDLDWMNRHRPGLWDHGWPEKLVNEQRHRYLGSSDAAFAVELTDMNANLPDVDDKDVDNPDDYNNEFVHHAVNRGFVTVLRGE